MLYVFPCLYFCFGWSFILLGMLFIFLSVAVIIICPLRCNSKVEHNAWHNKVLLNEHINLSSSSNHSLCLNVMVISIILGLYWFYYIYKIIWQFENFPNNAKFKCIFLFNCILDSFGQIFSLSHLCISHLPKCRIPVIR